MVALSEMDELTRRPKMAAQAARETTEEITRTVTRHPYRTGGLVLLIAGLIGLYFVLPELRRYARIERM